MSPIKYFKLAAFDNYANFKSRSTRSEFWYFTLFSFLILLVSIIFVALTVTNSGVSLSLIDVISFVLFAFAIIYLIVPAISVTVRRLHDVNKSSWLILLFIVPLLTLNPIVAVYLALASETTIIGFLFFINLFILIYFLYLLTKKSTEGINKYDPQVDLKEIVL